jgi:hypothetical protein
MKQVKCWAYVFDGVVSYCCTEEMKRLRRDDVPIDLLNVVKGQWIEMTGEVPEAEPERTCEVRWDREGGVWRLHGERHHGGSNVLELCLRAARERGLRVTNDPREVVLRPAVSPLRGWVLVDGMRSTCPFEPLESAREYAQQHGWRILREEPTASKPEQKTCEVRWCNESSEWEIRADEFHWARLVELTGALQYAVERGWRITNDPREVDLVETEDRQWVISDRQTTWRSERMSSGKADEVIRAKGWRCVAVRFLTHEPEADPDPVYRFPPGKPTAPGRITVKAEECERIDHYLERNMEAFERKFRELMGMKA